MRRKLSFVCSIEKAPLTIIFNNKNLISKDFMNVLGMAFDSKLNWQKQVQIAITKSLKSVHAIKLIQKHFNKKEILQILISNYYSVLFHNSEI